MVWNLDLRLHHAAGEVELTELHLGWIRFFWIRAGMIGWQLIGLSIMAKQYDEQGYISLSMALFQGFCLVSVLHFLFVWKFVIDPVWHFDGPLRSVRVSEQGVWRAYVYPDIHHGLLLVRRVHDFHVRVQLTATLCAELIDYILISWIKSFYICLLRLLAAWILCGRVVMENRESLAVMFYLVWIYVGEDSGFV